ncbi:ABC transporter permease [Aquabacterium sp.]|uniref:ABC transporter permease n=1 Tax=Aquabacterium sp. TaxID=1872578 RepID=UPI002C24C75E|nr:ABC transporter permease [Aquabacterium sp.]HSW08845.1 ABC transporter permease [Aquabacterium sp.]
MRLAWIVFLKELRDALRDRRTLLIVVLSSVAVGPVILVALSVLVAGIEQRAEAREVYAVGLDHAPTLRNYLERQTYVIKAAPEDYERQLVSRQFGEPVLVIPADFEADLLRGVAPLVELVSSSANTRAQGSLGRLTRLLQGFGQEQAMLRLALRGVAPALVQPVRMEERDLADPRARASQLTVMLPFFVLMAVLYGALHAALDTTAGERERGSLEPLLMNPASRMALVLGKWGAVASVGMLIAVLSCFSFLPAQWLLRSETLAAMFQFGLREAGLFLALLLPLAAMLAAVLMAVAIRCRSFKEAQANSTVVILAISLLPLVTVFNQEGEKPWHLWVPALAQITLMGRVLKGELIAWADLLAPLGVAALGTTLCVVFVARHLRGAAVR